jgi:hypothetical protein
MRSATTCPGCEPAVTGPRYESVLFVSAAVSASEPKVVTMTGMRNSPGVSVAVMGTSGSILRSQPSPPNVSPASRSMTDAGSIVKPAGRPSCPPTGNWMPTVVRTSATNGRGRGTPFASSGNSGGSVTVTVPVTAIRYDQLPARNVRLTSPVFAKRPLSQYRNFSEPAGTPTRICIGACDPSS